LDLVDYSLGVETAPGSRPGSSFTPDPEGGTRVTRLPPFPRAILSTGKESIPTGFDKETCVFTVRLQHFLDIDQRLLK
jgi:hypothetical protein